MPNRLVQMSLTLLILLAVLSGATLWRAEVRKQAAEARNPPQGRFVEVDGQRIHVLSLGPEDAPPVVLIHGSSGSVRDMTFRLAPALAARYRVHVFDRPGMGWSEPSAAPDTIFRQADVLARAAQDMGIRRPIVVGQSYGGAVALAWATARPGEVAALVNVSGPSHPWPTPLSTYYRVLSTPGLRHVAAWAIAAWVPDSTVRAEVASVFAPQQMPDGYLDHFDPRMTLRPATLLANAAQRAALLAEVTRMSTTYGRLTMPVEIVHGTEDDIVSLKLHAEQLVRDAPDAVFTPLAGLGHMPHHVATGEVAAAVDRAATRAGLR